MITNLRAQRLALLFFCFVWIGCEKEEAATENVASEKKEELVPVEVVTLDHGPIEAVLRFSTNLEAESAVQVFSQSSRLVTELLVEEGDRVRKGDVLLRLQNEEQSSQLERVKSQLDKARREYEQQKNLFAKELIAEQTFNDATYELEQLELSLADAERELGYTDVRAPITGTITQRMINLGDFITVNQQLFDMVDFNTIVARIYVPEKEIRRLRIGQKTRLFSDSLGGEARSGEVIRIAPIVDARSGTVKVTVSVPASEGLLPGMYVEVELVTDTREDALRIPKRAVIYDNQQGFIFRLRDDMTVERLPLVARISDQDNIEPVEGSGIEAGNRIIVAGQAGLKSGAKVRLAGVKPTDDESTSTAFEAEESQGDDSESTTETTADESTAEENTADESVDSAESES